MSSSIFYSANPDAEGHHTFYTTITTIPETRNCPNCVYLHDEELEEGNHLEFVNY